MRYILYTEKFYDVGSFKSTTHIQFLNKLQKIPTWLQEKPKPVFVDTLKMEAWAGQEAVALFQPRKFTKLDEV